MRIPDFTFHFSSLPLILFHIVFLFIVAANFPTGDYFLGWDSLSPEFNFSVNFERAFSATWQENYGLGTLGGHGFAGTLPHTIITYLLSFLLPEWAIRSAFTFLCLYLGGLGMFFLSRHVLSKIEMGERTLSRTEASFLAFLSALFYVLNLGTAQMFTIQLETFVGHYASLPWLFFSVVLLFEKLTKKRLLAFIVISFFSSLQGFIPSLFAAYAVALVLFLGVMLFQKHRFLPNLKKSMFILIVTGMVNAFWILPLTYYQISQNNVFLNSYNNLASTPHFIDVNQKYGDFQNVALLKGYLFDAYQLGGYVLAPFIQHLSQILPVILGYLFFFTLGFGLIVSAFRRKPIVLLAFSVVFLFFFGSIATNVFPFTYVVSLLRVISPTYEQAFRTAFTKFSIGLSFSYSLFLSVGLAYVLFYFHRFFTSSLKRLLLWMLVFLGIVYYGLPIFQGNLLYASLFVDIPQQYKDVMSYFKTQPDGRIADFPQECAEGWFAYKWGYFGSGFYWYGVKQPFLSRSFDVWSNYNENYYWEITQALRSENFEEVQRILLKYDATWILYDPNAYYCRNQYGSLTQERFIEYLKSDSAYRLVKTFTGPTDSPLYLFERVKPQNNSFVSFSNNVPNIGPSYEWNDADVAFSAYGTYITDPKEPFSAYYPFRTLFTKRNADEAEFQTEVSENSITFSQTLAPGLEGFRMNIADSLQAEKTLPIRITLIPRGGITEVSLSFLFPTLTLDGKVLFEKTSTIILGSYRQSQETIDLSLNGRSLLPVKPNEYQSILFTEIPNILSIKSGTTPLFEWTSTETIINNAYTGLPETLSLPSYSRGDFEVTLPKVLDQGTFGINDIQNQNSIPVACNELVESKRNKYEISDQENDKYIRLTSQSSTQCLTYTLDDTLTSEGYLLELSTKHIQGNALRFSVLNQDNASLLDQYLPLSNQKEKTTLIIQPNNNFGIGYSFQFVNSSESFQKTVNDVYEIDAWHIPYHLLTRIVLTNPDLSLLQGTILPAESVSHPNETYYTISSVPDDADTIILWQGFHSGWRAYEVRNENSLGTLFPMVFGKELSDHTHVNSWANGWSLKAKSCTNCQIVLIFVPQYLQYIGFGLLAISLLWLLVASVYRQKGQ